MKLFATLKLTDEERTRCLVCHDEQLSVAAFLDRECRLLEDTLARHWDAMTESPPAAGEVCRAADRFRQATQEAVRRHGEIQSIPAAASKFHTAEGSYFLHISAWAEANLAIMETLARGRPPFYVRFERLQEEATSAWRQAKETYQSFRRRLGLAAQGADALETALRTRDFQETRRGAWQPEPYTQDLHEIENRIIEPQEDGLKAIADIMMHNPSVGTNLCRNASADGPDEAAPIDRPDAPAWCAEASGARTEDCCDTAPATDPQDAAAWFDQGVSLAAQDRREEAVACYDKALEIDPQNAAAWFNKGVNLAELGRREEAVECFVQAIGIDPRDETIWCAKGVNLAALGRDEEAIGCWDRAMQLNTHCVAAWCAKGVSLATVGRQEEAVACCDEALRIDSAIAPVWSNKGDCLTALGRHEEAVVCCDKALEIDPQDEAAWYNKGVSLAALGRHEEALVCFDKTLSIDPRLGEAWSKKGNSLAVLRRSEEAIGCYARALRIDPRDAAAWYNKALREEACDRREDAAQSYRQFLEVAPARREDLIAVAKQRIQELDPAVTRDP